LRVTGRVGSALSFGIFFRSLNVLSEQEETNGKAGDPRQEVVVEGRVTELARAENHIEELVSARAIRPPHADVLWPLTHLFLNEDALGGELVLRDFSKRIVACRRFPSENFGMGRICDHVADVVVVSHAVEVVVEIRHDQHDDEICNDVELRLAVG